MKYTTLAAVTLACVWLAQAAGLAGEATNQTRASAAKVGVYDSRVVAFAQFWSEPYQQKLRERNKEAQQAKAAGETARFNELAAAMKKEQEQNHLRVFSTAPADDVLDEMKERVEAIKQEAGVAQLVSKWDAKALKEYKPAQQVDLTDSLLREFKLNEKQLKVVADMRKKEPLPLGKAEELIREGKL